MNINEKGKTQIPNEYSSHHHHWKILIRWNPNMNMSHSHIFEKMGHGQHKNQYIYKYFTVEDTD